jgi:hypothetical protein
MLLLASGSALLHHVGRWPEGERLAASLGRAGRRTTTGTAQKGSYVTAGTGGLLATRDDRVVLGDGVEGARLDLQARRGQLRHKVVIAIRPEGQPLGIRAD